MSRWKYIGRGVYMYSRQTRSIVRMHGNQEGTESDVAHIDFDRMVFIDSDGIEVDLTNKTRVMCPRSRGGHSPGWVISYSYGALCAEVLLEEPSTMVGRVLSKTVRIEELILEDSYPFGVLKV